MVTKYFRWHKLRHILWLLTFLIGCKQESAEYADYFSNSVSLQGEPSGLAHEWMGITAELSSSCEGFTTPVAARAVAYASMCMYESMLPGMTQKISLQTYLADFKYDSETENGQYYWPASLNNSLVEILPLLYPNMSGEFHQKISKVYNSQRELFIKRYPRQTILRSEEYGKRIAYAVFNYSKSDGGHDAFKNNFPDYKMPNHPGVWRPTESNQKPLLPQWGDNRTFGGNVVEFSSPSAPSSYSEDVNSLFYISAKSLYSTTQAMNEENKLLVRYWNKDSRDQIKHTVLLTSQILSEELKDLTFSVELYCKVALAISDAYVSAWNSIYNFTSIRPESFIQEYIDPTWKSYIVTPPYPEYTSGFSVHMNVWAEVMSSYFGTTYAFADYTQVHRKEIGYSFRRYASFQDAANEASISQWFAGIHFRESINMGLRQGKSIGKLVAEINLSK